MGLVPIIDDDADARRVLEKFLIRWGYRTAVADSGEAGFAAISKERPDLIIVDGMMHGMNGVEFIRLLRANEHTVTIPVILNTAIHDHTFTDNAMEKGANEIWIKTLVSIDHMQERVATYLR